MMRDLRVVESPDRVQVLLLTLLLPLPPLPNVRLFFDGLHLVPDSVLEDFVQVRASLRPVRRWGVALRLLRFLLWQGGNSER